MIQLSSQRIVLWGSVAFVALWTLIPFAGTMWASFMTEGQLVENLVRTIESPTLDNYRSVFGLGQASAVFGGQAEAVGRALEDALAYHAVSSEYVANILEQRARLLPEPGALHLTRREDLLDLELPEPDLSVYDSQTETPHEEPEHAEEHPDR